MATIARGFTLGLVVAALALCPSRQARAQFTLYGASDAFPSVFYQVDPANGSLTTVTTNTSAFYSGLDAQPVTGTLYAAGGSFLYTVDPATGQYTSIKEFTGAGAGNVFNLSFAPSGLLYGIGNNDTDDGINTNGNLYLVDPVTADTVLLGSSNQFIFGLEFGPDGTLYGTSQDLYVINPLDGSATDRGQLTPTASNGLSALIDDLDFAPNGTLYGVSGQLFGNNTDSLYSIDPNTATATLLGVTGGDLDAIASLSVPEPGTWACLALGGLGGLGLLARRRAVRV